MSRFLFAVAALALLPVCGMADNLTSHVVTVHASEPIAMKLDDFFKTLKRPDTPNHWLIAPADFTIKPDAVAPVFAAPASALREAFKSVALRSKGNAVVEESAFGMHVVATTLVFRFKDDIYVRFIPLAHHQSTLAVYSASRTGYWDTGTNRRRLEDWIERTRKALEAGGK
jgi:uncharacterized protein (DUF1499 family)